MNQLNLNFNGYDVANAYGVFVDCEILEYSAPSRRPNAEIRIANASFGFCWGMSAYFSQSGFTRMPNECDGRRGNFSSTRDGALKLACSELISKLTTKSASNKDLNLVRKWVDSLI